MRSYLTRFHPTRVKKGGKDASSVESVRGAPVRKRKEKSFETSNRAFGLTVDGPFPVEGKRGRV